MSNDLEHSPDDWGKKIRTSRLILLMETKDGYFRQMQFTQKQFKKLSNFIDDELLPDTDNGMRAVRVSHDHKLPQDKFLGWRSYYPEPDNLPYK